MKKLFSIASILLLTVTLVGCDEIALSAEEIATLQEELQDNLDEVTALTENLTALQETVDGYEDEIADLEFQIEQLQALIYDNVITVTFDDGYGTFISGTIGFNEEYEGTLLDLLDEHYDVQFTTFEYGSFINGIEGITTMQGNYISLGKNGEAAMVGVDAITFDDGDVFSFELEWWDTGLQAVYEGIQLFLDNHALDYVNSSSADYAVVAGLSMLGVLDEYITQTEMETLIDASVIRSYQVPVF